jgi:hypothetical protein
MVPELVLDSQSRSAFRKLGGYPGCQNLSAMDKVPAALLHHAIALSRLSSKNGLTDEALHGERP